MLAKSSAVRLYPVYITRATPSHEFILTIIGDPDGPPGDAQVHVVYPNSATACCAQDYVTLLRCFAAHLLAHADQYDAALAMHG
jgi:hypothetical protein